MNVREARAILFASIEGGSPFWSREIELLGPIGVVEKALDGDYDIAKFEKTLRKLNTSNPSQILEKIAGSGGIFMTREEPFWPEQLDDLVAPPIGLVAKGALEVLQLRSLAIVGTRNPTNYGVRVAGDFAAGFVDREWAIISGGAYGIDAAAHRGALVGEGVTVAVLAAGIDVNYPAGHMRLFEEITENGLIVSEVMPGTCAVPSRFLTRNRVIAALSRATLVVEAAFRSGSLRTARDAAELLRPVMAIPGPITSPTSEGCHRLIGERVAEVVTSVADAMEFVSSSR
ncbi:MAG TPA: DNA-processing protein DprA [Candidatus Paceibacterota bacterium]|nr:DNA-processing protein DprA [Candidatus Paceibacterota bacterium]